MPICIQGVASPCETTMLHNDCRPQLLACQAFQQGSIFSGACQGLNLGVVTAIAAPASLRATFRGGGGHAGALLMPQRADASLAAAELALQVESATLAHGERSRSSGCSLWPCLFRQCDCREPDALRAFGQVGLRMPGSERCPRWRTSASQDLQWETSQALHFHRTFWGTIKSAVSHEP